MTDYDNFDNRTKALIDSEIVIWLTTTDSDLTPQPRPVWFIWHEQGFLIFSRPETFKLQHIEKRQNVSVHFNSDEKADHAAIFRGKALIDRSTPALIDIPAYVEKYRDEIKGLDMTVPQFNEEYSVPIRVQIHSHKEF